MGVFGEKKLFFGKGEGVLVAVEREVIFMEVLILVVFAPSGWRDLELIVEQIISSRTLSLLRRTE